MNAESLPAMRHGDDAGERTSQASVPVNIAVAATFTADLLREPLEFWMRNLGIAIHVEFASYGQVMQELLDRAGLFARNQRGFNVLLVRPEDWIRDRAEHSGPENIAHLRAVANELVEGASLLRERTAASMLVFIAATSEGLAQEYRQPLAAIQRQLLERLAALPHTHCFCHADVARLYPVAAHEDPGAERIGHIPYTEEYFVALATLLARRIAVLVKPPYKVIATDCDNTLWKGICGEDGPTGIELTSSHLDLQRMLVRQHDAGVLLCLCSKNNAADVEAVFAANRQMPLRHEHFVAARVNWNPKSSNLQSLSEELGLSLDSFVLIDDSAVECAEVRAHCPAVLALQFPDTAAEIAHFLDHVWVFDRVGVTEEARQRTAQYKENRARAQALLSAPDLAQFIASLDLQVSIEPMQSGQLERVAELIARTNQFNLTAVRRGAAELQALWQSGELRSLTVHVRDRFGDYGLVGAVLLRCGSMSLDVDTFVLSCRVLGRGVEQRIANELGIIARREGAHTVVLRYRPTPRNAPARIFLGKSFKQFETPCADGEGESVFAVPADYAAQLRAALVPAEVVAEAAGATATRAARRSASANWHEVAYRLSRLHDIVKQLDRAVKPLASQHVRYVPPRTPTQAIVAEVWAAVLGVERVGIHDDFFKLGGDSLRAVQAIARMGALSGRELSIFDFFEAATVEEVARALTVGAALDHGIHATAHVRPVALSSAQQRLWFIEHLEGGSAAYHIPLAVRLEGDLDRTALQRALDALIERHGVLRARFTDVEGEPLQQLAAARGFRLRFVDLGALGASERDAEVTRQLQEEAADGFDLRGGPPVRGRLLQLTRDIHVLLITMHHIVSDGWSLGVLARDLAELYEANVENRPATLPVLPIQYFDYVLWQRGSLLHSSSQQQLAYWKRQLDGAPELLELPTDRVRPAVQSYRGAAVHIALDTALTRRVKAVARRLNLTLAMALHAAWIVVLAKLSGREDIVVGMPVANRRRSELERLIGLFVNTLAVRVKVDADLSATQLLLRVKKVMLEAFAHQDLPFEQVVEALHPARSLGHSPLFQVMDVLQNATSDLLQLPGLRSSAVTVPQHAAQFDLTLTLRDTADGIEGELIYATDLFEPATIERWAQYFQNVVSTIAHDPQRVVGRIALMSAEETRRVVQTFNATRTEYPRHKLVNELFEELAGSVPQAVAVTSEGISLTYSELNAKANQFAHYLIGQGVRRGDCVPMVMERTLALLIGQLAVLKAGGVYLPIDPLLPAERRAFMIRDCGAHLVVALGEAAQLGFRETRCIDYDAVADRVRAQPAQNPSVPGDSLGAAYVMYTSGSTGVPKGVVVPHHAITRLVINNSYARIEADACIAHYSNPAFDASTFEVWGALLSGARVVIVPQSIVLDGVRFAETLARERVTFLYMSVGLFNQYVDVLASVFSQLRCLMVGGDALEPQTIRRVLRSSPPQRLLNVYGPTECTTFATTHLIEAVDEGVRSIPIGRPMANARLYVLDAHGEPVAVGVTGELYIAGAGVALGYLNRPELTAERFLAERFDAGDPQGRMYRTGDLVRWRADGTIDFLGRNDHQVKIRGYRIELGEIESELLRLAGVKEAAVLAREDVPREKRLVAYVVTDDLAGPSAETLRAHAKAVLPDYMVPSAFVTLERLPLTASGKLDRRRLPVPGIEAYASRAYEAPEGELEQAIAEIWARLLQVDRVGRHDSFFDLGGHSLSAMQLLARLRASMGVELPMRVLFECATLRQLAEHVEQARRVCLPERLAAGGAAALELLEQVASMSDAAAQELLRDLTMEVRP